jgi:hypothetical protein
MRYTMIVLFWITQVAFGLASAGPVLDLIANGKTAGQLNLIPLLLAWIAVSLTWGFGCTMMAVPVKAEAVNDLNSIEEVLKRHHKEEPDSAPQPTEWLERYKPSKWA